MKEQLGAIGEAADYFQQAIKAQTDWPRPHYQLAQLKGRISTDAEIEAIRSLSVATAVSEDAYRYFARALVEEQSGFYDEAFQAWKQGNEAQAALSDFNIDEREQFHQLVFNATSEALSRSGEEAGFSDKGPLFIVGMPRSGTTLTGQILSSHSRILGLGEVSAVHEMTLEAARLSGRQYPDLIRMLSDANFAQLGKSLVARFPERPAGVYVLDVTPTNFQHIGLVALSLPKAKFIHCHRDPLDTCFSIFKLPFGRGQDYAHDLVSLGQQYRSYWKLMQNWKQLFPDRILDVSYEQTVSDTEEQAKRLCDFLSVDFDPNMLDFHQSKNLVRSPSTSQVRKPIYKDAVQAWRRYEDHLGPLIEALGELVSKGQLKP